MIQEGKALSDIDNFYSINLIINSNEISDCYRAHGIIANTFSSVKFVDYISKPKFDWYKSLNTEIIGPDGKKIELSIRTQEMERMAEDGFASKFSLKNKRKALNISKKDRENWGEWMQEMIEQYPDNAIQIIWNSIKVNIFDVDVVVYNKLGEAVHLPEGSTVLDFAFAKSHDDGLHCISAKINGVIRNLNYELKYGDQVEIITSQSVTPDPKWQQFVVTYKAVIALFHYFKENPFIEVPEQVISTHSFIKMKIVGEDRDGMLKQITEAIGKNSMHELHISAQEEDFEGVFTLKISENDDVNNIFLKILNIQGIKSVNLIDED
jgi:(p)ppGpp synthase/HD superfamily hydrolase